jgi:hypothetical protein
MGSVTPLKAGEIIEAVITRGDLAQLSPEERAKYYVKVCESVGLNPMTRPFEYITLNGKLTLYARKDCTDQLRAVHKVSVVDLSESEREGVFIVTAKVQNGDGRTDAAKGAVNIQGLKGEALANAMMKAETKAKRRATLSICGLGFLDEAETEDIPVPNGNGKQTLPKKDARDIYTKLQTEVDRAASREDLKAWGEAAKERIALLPQDWQDILRLRYQEKLVDLQMQESAPRLPGRASKTGSPDPDVDFYAWLRWLDGRLGTLPEGSDIEAFWNGEIASTFDKLISADQDEAMAIYRKHEARIAP